MGHVLFTASGERDLYLLEAYLALTIIYWPISVIIQKLFASLEKKLEYKRKETKKIVEIKKEERKEEDENRLGLRAGSIS